MKYDSFVDVEALENTYGEEEIERENLIRKKSREDKRLKDRIRKERQIDRYFEERGEW